MRFNVCSFVQTDDVLETTLSIDGEHVRIREIKISDRDIEGVTQGGIWLVQNGELHAVLGKRYKIFYGRFLAMLVTALRKKSTPLPTRDINISWDDVDRAGETSNYDQLQCLVDSIARGG